MSLNELQSQIKYLMDEFLFELRNSKFYVEVSSEKKEHECAVMIKVRREAGARCLMKCGIVINKDADVDFLEKYFRGLLVLLLPISV